MHNIRNMNDNARNGKNKFEPKNYKTMTNPKNNMVIKTSMEYVYKMDFTFNFQ
jgi:hypothetical protein